jgi:protein tyrosine/serine phosphatase
MSARPRSTPGSPLRRLLLTTLALVLLTAATAGGYYEYVESGGNLHAVEEGTVYRSRQLSGPELERVIGTYGIRSVLNLRGANPGSPWYDVETEVSAAHDVAHYDYRISARRPVSPAQVDEILAIVRVAPKPLLIHCQAGADRTGLVAAAYRFSHGQTVEQADRALSLRFGHFPWLGSKTRAMDDSFAAFVAAREPGTGG